MKQYPLMIILINFFPMLLEDPLHFSAEHRTEVSRLEDPGPDLQTG